MKAIGCNPSGIGNMSKTSICGGGGTGKSPEVSRVRGDSKLGTRGLGLSSDDSLCKFFKKLRFNLSFYFLFKYLQKIEKYEKMKMYFKY